MTPSTTATSDDLTPAQRAAAVRRLEKAIGALTGVAIQRMEERLAWYRAMPPDNRSWIGLVVQAGIAAFVEWFRNPQDRAAISADVFGTAPRELTRSVTLRQTVELVRTTIEVVEEGIGQIAQGPVEQAALREG
ncbi:MAG: PucR family transcriptional regulator, partial [Catenulispora sp.]